MTAEDFKQAIQEYANPKDAVFLQRFFKTGRPDLRKTSHRSELFSDEQKPILSGGEVPVGTSTTEKSVFAGRNSSDEAGILRKSGRGEYGEGDIFIGVRVPQNRKVCKQFRDLPLEEVQKLLDSPIHEHRLAAVLILVDQFNRAVNGAQQKIYDLYLKNVYSGRVNNWDIIDSSAPYIIGPYLCDKPKDIIFNLAKDNSVWCRRVSILGTFMYIKQGNPKLSLQIATILLSDKHDLIQKAVGWMLREIGKNGQMPVLLGFLEKNASKMPRTMLRYSIEHLTTDQKHHYMILK